MFKNQTTIKKPRTEFFDATFIYFILLVSFVLIRILASANLLNFLGDFASYAFTILIQLGIMLFLPIFLYCKLRKKTLKETLKDFRFAKINLKAIGIAVCIGVLVYILNIAVSSFFSLLISLFGYENIGSTSTMDYSILAFFLALLTTALLPGFCEEIASRGLLLRGFKNLGMKKAILLSGLFFGLMHLNVDQFFYATIIGWFLAFICLTTGNIIPGMIIHFMNNGISTYMAYATHNGWPLGNILDPLQNVASSGNYISTMLVIFLILITAVFLLIWLTYLLVKFTTLEKIKKLGEDLNQTLTSEDKTLKINTLKIEIPFDALGFSLKQKYYPPLRQKIFQYSTIFLGVIILISTFIWGVL